MKQKLMDSYTNEEFAAIVAESFSYADCLRRLGYGSNSGDATNSLKAKINQLNISTAHFNYNTNSIKRTEENVFCENSTADQKTLRKYYEAKYPQTACSICNQTLIWNHQALRLILDHINGTNTDNRLENLRWVCPNCNSQLPTTNARNPHHNKYYCVDCGKQISQGAIRCIECAAKNQQVVERPTRDELKNLIRTKPFTHIAKQFGISDNGIRKWCDTYNLPRKKTDIDKMTDEEWENI